MLAVPALKSVDEHWPINLLQDILPNLDHVVRCDAHDVRVKSRVMQFAEGNAVGDYSVAGRVRITDDVRSVEELIALQSTDGAVALIGIQYALAELSLVEALLNLPGGVPAPYRRLFGRIRDVSHGSESSVVDADGKRQRRRVISHNEDRIRRDIPARDDSLKVDEGRLCAKRLSEPDVVPVRRVRAAIPVAQKVVVAHRVVIRSLLALNDRCSEDAERDVLQEPRLEDSLLGTYERDPLSVELKSFKESIARQRPSPRRALKLVKKRKRREPNAKVDVLHRADSTRTGPIDEALSCCMRSARQSLTMSEPLSLDVADHFQAKARWHRERAALPLKEKVRILLELQKQELPLLARRRPLRPWEKPWPIEP